MSINIRMHFLQLKRQCGIFFTHDNKRCLYLKPIVIRELNMKKDFITILHIITNQIKLVHSFSPMYVILTLVMMFLSGSTVTACYFYYCILFSQYYSSYSLFMLSSSFPQFNVHPICSFA